MFYHVQSLINPIVADEPDPSAANALQEGLGGQFGEMRTMMQYLFQSFNFRGNATPYLDLIQGVGIEEISHVELISKTIARLLDGAPEYQWKKFDTPGKGGKPQWTWRKSNKIHIILSLGHREHCRLTPPEIHGVAPMCIITEIWYLI